MEVLVFIPILLYTKYCIGYSNTIPHKVLYLYSNTFSQYCLISDPTIQLKLQRIFYKNFIHQLKNPSHLIRISKYNNRKNILVCYMFENVMGIGIIGILFLSIGIGEVLQYFFNQSIVLGIPILFLTKYCICIPILFLQYCFNVWLYCVRRAIFIKLS